MVLQHWSDEDAQESLTLDAVPNIKASLMMSLGQINTFIDQPPALGIGTIVYNLACQFDVCQLLLSKARCHVAQSDVEQLAQRFRDLAGDLMSGIKLTDLLDVFVHTSHDLERIIEED